MPVAAGFIPDATNPIVQVTEIHGTRDAGWTETYFIRLASGTPDFALNSAVSRHQFIIDARRTAIPPVHIIESLRVSDVKVSGDSILKFPPEANLGPGTGPPGDVNPALGYFMTTNENTGTVNITRTYRGFGTDNTIYNSSSPRSVIPPGGVRGSLNLIGVELITTRTLGGATTMYVMKSFQRPELPLLGPQFTGPGTVTADAAGRLQFTFPSPLPAGWEAGKRFHVRAPRVKCVRGVTGIHNIVSIATIGGISNVLTNTIYRCAGSTLADVVPRGFLHVDAWFPINRFEIGGVGKRDTGRPSYLTRGRQSARP